MSTKSFQGLRSEDFGQVNFNSRQRNGSKVCLDSLQRQCEQDYFLAIGDNFDPEEVVVVRDICAGEDNKLIAKAGMPLQSSQIAKIRRFGNLLMPVDKCLKLECQISMDKINELAGSLNGKLKDFGKLFNEEKILEMFEEIMNEVDFDNATLNKLTLVQRKDSNLFDDIVCRCLLSIKVGLDIKLSRSEILDLVIATLFSDIGLIHIDPKILQKPSLTQEEYDHIKVHPLVGFIILEESGIADRSENPERIKMAVLNSHERIDGKGYPRGLPGDELGLFERIISVVSDYQSNVQKKTMYFENLSKDEIIKEVLAKIRGKSGHDPDIVKLFVSYYMPPLRSDCDQIDSDELKKLLIWLKALSEKICVLASEMSPHIENSLEASKAYESLVASSADNVKSFSATGLLDNEFEKHHDSFPKLRIPNDYVLKDVEQLSGQLREGLSLIHMHAAMLKAKSDKDVEGVVMGKKREMLILCSTMEHILKEGETIH